MHPRARSCAKSAWCESRAVTSAPARPGIGPESKSSHASQRLDVLSRASARGKETAREHRLACRRQKTPTFARKNSGTNYKVVSVGFSTVACGDLRKPDGPALGELRSPPQGHPLGRQHVSARKPLAPMCSRLRVAAPVSSLAPMCSQLRRRAATHARSRSHSRPTAGGLPCSLAALRVRAACRTDARRDAYAPEPSRRMRSSSERRRSFSAAMRAASSACSRARRFPRRFFRRRR